jgi:hypothetical protein
MTLSRDRRPPPSARKAPKGGRPVLPRPLLLALLSLCVAARHALAADDPCAGFSGDVIHERTLFAGTAQPIAAGREPTSAPPLAADRLYELQLAPQGQVAMLLPPGKKTQLTDAYGGLARLQLARPGSYRISVDQGAWIDVVGDGHMIDSSDFQGRPGCSAPHKIVQYLLPVAHELVLQVSAAAAPRLRLTITLVD